MDQNPYQSPPPKSDSSRDPLSTNELREARRRKEIWDQRCWSMALALLFVAPVIYGIGESYFKSDQTEATRSVLKSMSVVLNIAGFSAFVLGPLSRSLFVNRESRD